MASSSAIDDSPAASGVISSKPGVSVTFSGSDTRPLEALTHAATMSHRAPNPPGLSCQATTKRSVMLMLATVGLERAVLTAASEIWMRPPTFWARDVDELSDDLGVEPDRVFPNGEVHVIRIVVGHVGVVPGVGDHKTGADQGIEEQRIRRAVDETTRQRELQMFACGAHRASDRAARRVDAGDLADAHASCSVAPELQALAVVRREQEVGLQA